MAALTEEAVSAYLRENPQFLASWFVEHADDDTLKTLARKLKQDAISLATNKTAVLESRGQNHHMTNTNNRLLTVHEGSNESDEDKRIVPQENGTDDDNGNDATLRKYTTFSKVNRF